jgi:ADP-heptose:LPS heptosyltransferase
MRGRYLIRNPYSAAAVLLLDRMLSLGAGPRLAPSGAPRRILAANWASHGDAVLTIPALEAIRRAYPDCHIGFLASDRSAKVIADTGLVDDIHVINHWMIDREKIKLSDRVRSYIPKRRVLLDRLKQKNYDAGIDFNPHFPPAHPLFFHVGIPTRIGFTSGGFGPLLTHPVAWIDDDRHAISHGEDVLASLFARDGKLVPALKANYPRERLHENPTARRMVGESPYILVHPGTGADYKLWNEDSWRDVISTLDRGGHRVILVGSGAKERVKSERLARAGMHCLNLTDQLTWRDFAWTVAHARAVICLDSVCGHLAAAFSIPTVSIFSGANKISRWRPLGDASVPVTAPVPCSPCNRPGCATMPCIKGVRPTDVLAALDGLLCHRGDDDV